MLSSAQSKEAFRDLGTFLKGGIEHLVFIVIFVRLWPLIILGHVFSSSRFNMWMEAVQLPFHH